MKGLSFGTGSFFLRVTFNRGFGHLFIARNFWIYKRNVSFLYRIIGSMIFTDKLGLDLWV